MIAKRTAIREALVKPEAIERRLRSLDAVARNSYPAEYAALLGEDAERRAR
jgi:hypothetical protein